MQVIKNYIGISNSITKAEKSVTDIQTDRLITEWVRLKASSLYCLLYTVLTYCVLSKPIICILFKYWKKKIDPTYVLCLCGGIYGQTMTMVIYSKIYVFPIFNYQISWPFLS